MRGKELLFELFVGIYIIAALDFRSMASGILNPTILERRGEKDEQEQN